MVWVAVIYHRNAPSNYQVGRFSGTPWTKTWGMMFALSFVAIKLFHALTRTDDPDSEHASSMAAILDRSTIE